MAEGSVKEQVGDVVSNAKRRVGLEKPTAADDDGNVGIVRGALRAFADGDMDGFLDALREDVIWEAPGGGHFPGGGEHEGRETVRDEFIADVGRTYTAFGFVPDSFVDADEADAVIVIGSFAGEGVEGGRLDEPAVLIWDFQGNAIARVRVFTDTAGFPNVVTERKQKEWEEEKREKEESKDEDDSDGDDGSEDTKASAEKSEDESERNDKDADESSKDDDRNGSGG
jgi:ketosteroid isomerase-like protein